eukprot:CAMPEP_0204582036 /NCGR_PEP_ID=MMETSP0661-20131031/44991_1 /ASSEMBLY_ACC=CAM_ASM_000606 /TAXON_ID=109239 /ORGANISM="Alexandrium margalefi, Strain AMGDE01CS-322" /LENGTH=75 /DNA_ID=CAMNT_0051591283 /DNA_START=96 /DNA_END=320 /DNA_ORIENTATION=+
MPRSFFLGCNASTRTSRQEQRPLRWSCTATVRKGKVAAASRARTGPRSLATGLKGGGKGGPSQEPGVFAAERDKK